MHSPSMPTCIAILAIPLTLAACSGMGMPGTANVPASIAVPSGNTLAFTLKGSGLQNYECRARADAPGGHDWVLVSPEAVLRDRNDALVGRHYGGPTWEHADGSKVVGKVVATAAAPVAGNIPWLLLQATSTGPGAFRGVTYIQRTDTSGGIAPSDSCTAATIGRKNAVRYSADYLFFRP